MPDTLTARIERTTAHLSQLKAQQSARLARDRARQRDAQRKADAHRKIELGGVVIASGCGDWNPASVVGALLDCRQVTNTSQMEAWRERGITYLEQREAERHAEKKPR